MARDSFLSRIERQRTAMTERVVSGIASLIADDPLVCRMVGEARDDDFTVVFDNAFQSIVDEADNSYDHTDQVNRVYGAAMILVLRERGLTVVRIRDVD